MTPISGVCEEDAQERVDIVEWTGSVRVTETLPDGSEQFEDIFKSACPNEHNVQPSLAVTNIACNYNRKSITLGTTVSARSIGTVLDVTWGNSTKLYRVTLEGLCVAIGSNKSVTPELFYSFIRKQLFYKRKSSPFKLKAGHKSGC